MSKFLNKENWDAFSKAKYLYNITTGSKDVNAGYGGTLYPFFTCSEETSYIDEYSFNCEAILVAGNGQVGMTKYYNGKFDAYQRTYVCYNFDKRLNIHFLNYYISIVFPEYLKNVKTGSVIEFIKMPDMKNLPIPLFSKEKQQRIVDFLDAKISIIDELISNLENQIQDMKSYQTAIISEYLDKKSSSLYKLKYKNHIIDNRCEKEGMDYFALENIESGTGEYVETDSLYSSLGAIVCEKDDICFGKLRPYLKKFYRVSKTTTCSNEIAVFREKNKTHYLYYIIQSEQFIQLCNAYSEGTKMPRINIEKIKNWKFYYPSIEEQMAFVSKMEKIDYQIKSLIKIKKDKINELRNYKKALIYEYVTGMKEVI